MLQKLIHKKWMVLSLAIGNILLIAIASAYPMFRDASLTRMLRDEFASYEMSKNTDPTLISITGKLRKKGTADGYVAAAGFADTIIDRIGISGELLLKHDYLTGESATPAVMRETSAQDARYVIGTIEGFEENTQLISGRMYSGEIVGDNGDTIEAVVTVNGFVKMSLVVGDELDFKYLKLPDGKLVNVVVVGVIAPAEGSEEFWQYSSNNYSDEFFISESLYDGLFGKDLESYERNTSWYLGFDYTEITHTDADRLMEVTDELLSGATEYCAVEKPAYLKFLQDYEMNKKKIEATLIILQVPVLVLLLAFIYMMSGQMYDMEQNEIAVMRSRGASKGQIFSLYFLQAVFMSVVGAVIGLPLGNVLCRAIGSASAFLEFGQRRALPVSYSPSVFIYAGISMAVSILLGVIPSITGNRGSIVKSVASRARSKRPLWQKLFVDVILLGISIYGYYNFSRQKEYLEAQVLEGQSLDPLLYLSSSLFILGSAMLMLRIIPLLARLLFALFKNRWSPALFASFSEIIRSIRKQYFIMSFLILTAALGIFNTTVARTIAANNVRNLEYVTGADIVLSESWPNNKYIAAEDPEIPLIYEEPDFSKYELTEGVEETARVFIDDLAVVGKNYVRLMGINTKEFGEATSLPAGLLDTHYYNYLNDMSKDADYVLVSSSFRDIDGYAIGDKITYKESKVEITGTIVGFMDYFPGFETKKLGINADGTVYTQPQYLIVAHLSTIQNAVGMRPYQVWIKLKEGAGSDGVYDLIEERNIKLTGFKDLALEKDELLSDTLFQGTNGILTLSFIVILVLCFIGYLIYWTLTISSRELLLGVLRAMGMSRREVLSMLINEQIFSGIIPLACGAGIGFLASRLFVPLIQIAYAANNQVLPLTLVTQREDLIRMFVIIFVMILICFIVLARQIRSLKIAQALKLGED